MDSRRWINLKVRTKTTMQWLLPILIWYNWPVPQILIRYFGSQFCCTWILFHFFHPHATFEHWSDCAQLQFITKHIAKAWHTSFTKAHLFKLGEKEKHLFINILSPTHGVGICIDLIPITINFSNHINFDQQWPIIALAWIERSPGVCDDQRLKDLSQRTKGFRCWDLCCTLCRA